MMLRGKLQQRASTGRSLHSSSVPKCSRPCPMHSSALPALLVPSQHGVVTVGQERVSVRAQALVADRPSTSETASTSSSSKVKQPLKVIIAGAGIGGLLLAVSLLKKGMEVEVYERDLTAIRGEGKYRGPIQVQSNALAALEAIDTEVAEEVLAAGCITGDRINGLCDGVSGDWYVKFDTFHPAVDRGLPVTRVISRVTLQQILAKAVVKYGGEDIIRGNSHVVGFEETVDPATGKQVVNAQMEDGRVATGDLLVGADGIWSKIRRELIGETQPNYSGYTCYTGISDFTPADIDIVGYRVFLGNRQYFVSSDVGGGKMQWYAFHNEPQGGKDEEGMNKTRLLQIFGHWCDNVVDLIKATPEEDILRRDIFDRPPIFTWHKGRVVLLGDSAHAMQPNLGQGGCMAIEDAFQLAADLSKAVESSPNGAAGFNPNAVLSAYQTERLVRASTIHGMAGMAAFMASTYKAYLGEGLGPLSGLTKLKIPHPGRVGGRIVMNLTMPSVLQWVLGGNADKFVEERAPHCLVGDKPRLFGEEAFARFLTDDDALVRATQADWILLAERGAGARSGGDSVDATSTNEVKGCYIPNSGDIIVGRAATANGSSNGSSNGNGAGTVSLTVDCGSVAERHARVWRAPGDGNTYHIAELPGATGTWVNGERLSAGQEKRLMPGDVVEFGQCPSREPFKVKLQHISLRHDEFSGFHYNTITVGRRPGGEAVKARSLEDASLEGERMLAA